MGTILRLQGLATKASTEDIRSFFEGIHIPDGGVFVVGGVFGEAFIAFNSEADGLLAMHRSGHFLKDSKVDLHMSSMVELEDTLETLFKSSPKPCTGERARSSSNGKTMPVKVRPGDPRTANRPSSAPEQLGAGPGEETLNIDSLDSAFLLGVCTLLQGLPSSETKMDTCESQVTEPSSADAVLKPSPGYVRVFGLPLSTTKNDIYQFFRGLNVQEVIVNVNLGVSHGCLIKFNSCQDAHDALSFNQCSMGSACVEVRTASEKMWISALQECEDVCHEGAKVKQSPLKDTVNYKKEVPEWPRKKHCNKDFSHKSKKMKNCQTTTALSENMQYIVMVSHLPMNITKTEIKDLFGCPNIAHTNVLHLLDTKRNRTDKAFVMFNRLADYDYAINLSGCHLGSHTIEVSAITKEKMKTMMKTKGNPVVHKQRLMTQMKKPHQKGKLDASKDIQSHKLDTTTRTCLYVRNMPANVQRSQIKALFINNNLNEDDITLLRDSDGRCIGEAVVQFQSQTNAALALMHHGIDFLGSKLLLTSISIKQMENILANNT